MLSLHRAANAARAQGLDVLAVVVKRPLADNPPAAILQATTTCNAKMIVMATHGCTALSRVLHGSVADQVIYGTDVPVLLIRPGTKRSREQHMLCVHWPDSLTCALVRQTPCPAEQSEEAAPRNHEHRPVRPDAPAATASPAASRSESP